MRGALGGETRVDATRLSFATARDVTTPIAIPAVWIASALAFAVGTGCTPTHFRLQPYRDDPVAAADLARRAESECVKVRGAGRVPPHSFTSDGCSMVPDGTWVACCVEHDIAYWCGGNAEQRREADRGLRACVTDQRSSCLGETMYLGVRVGGIPWQPFPWRWAYGWDGLHGYDEGADEP